MRARIEKNYVVEYAHRLARHEKLCRYIHGHSGGIKVVFEGPIDLYPGTGMVVDFGKFGWLKKIVDELDHTLILQKSDQYVDFLLIGAEDHKVDPIRLVVTEGPPTAENICVYLVEKIEKYLRGLKINSPEFVLCSVSFEETKGNTITIERNNK